MTERKQTVLLLFGGRGGEHRVSRATARTFSSLIDRSRYRVRCVFVTETGHFRLCRTDDIPPDSDLDRAHLLYPTLSLSPMRQCRASDGETFYADLSLIALHGVHGEDGEMQGMLSSVGIPYTGSDTLSSALCMHKALTKEIVRAEGIPTLPHVLLRAGEFPPPPFPYPFFVKPVRSGSSVGAGVVTDERSYSSALQTAWETDRLAMAEPLCDGRELEVAVYSYENDVRVSAVGEVGIDGFYDYARKYEKNTPALTVPADIPRPLSDAARAYAKTAFSALGCRHYARVDFFCDGARLYLNEVNTLPGFTAGSMFPHLLMCDGVSPSAFLASLLSEACL